MRRFTIFITAVLLAALLPHGGAGAQFFDCLEPDDDEPVVYQPRVGMNTPAGVEGDNAISIIVSLFTLDPRVGTRFEADVWDLPNRDDENWHNGVVSVLLDIDGEHLFAMEPSDERWGEVKEMGVSYVVPPFTIQPGFHTATMIAEDSCGNVGRYSFDFYDATFVAAFTCEDGPRPLCP